MSRKSNYAPREGYRFLATAGATPVTKFPANYYEDGIDHLKMALDMRETVAFEHWRGNPDFSMGDIIRKIT